jgi:hypothetical protein
MNKELQALFEQDQADRRAFEQLDHEQIQQMLQRDRVRRQRVEELIGSEGLQVPEDYFHAAMVFQHGETLEDYWQAHELAGRGAELGHPGCRWLSAAAYDRWLMNQGKPQKYGTQYTTRDDGPYRLWDVDPNTTDEERAAWNVPSLAEALRQAEELTQRRELSRQGVSLETGPKRLASLEVPGLSVEIIAFDDVFVHQVPDQEQPAREELPAPDNFPAGWKLYRFGEGYLATAADGQEVISWFKVPESKLSYACREEEEVPQLEAIQLGEQTAILRRGADASFMQLFMRSGDAYYVVGGQVALNELLQIANSIP